MILVLIICTYKRVAALRSLLESVRRQTRYPDRILIVDGSPDNETRTMLATETFFKLEYFKVEPHERGLTKQRNFGIARSGLADIIAFLDDDTILEPDYFAELLRVYETHPDAIGAGGYITNEVKWQKGSSNLQNPFCYDGWCREEGTRWTLRRKLRLDSTVPPGYMPTFGHGRSVSFLPPSGKIYPVQQLMGGVSSFRKSVFETFTFSTYFQGYGLYEDADFTLRVSGKGQLYLNTAARLGHFHEASGRPDRSAYGRMVVRNGWYVWRVANPDPNLKDCIKWHSITGLLLLVRLVNVFTGPRRQESFKEVIGRLGGWFSLFLHPPK